MNSKQLKFKIKDLLLSLPVSEYEVAMKHLPDHLGVSRATFKRWIYARIEDNIEINGCYLLLLSMYFDCRLEDLFTLPPKGLTRKEFNHMYKQAV